MPCSFDVTTKGDVSVVRISGRLTLGEGAKAFRDLFSDLIDTGKKKIVLDLANVQYIDSSGIGELFSGYMRATNLGGTVKVTGLQGRVKDLLQITKLYTVFDTYENAEEAVKALEANSGNQPE